MLPMLDSLCRETCRDHVGGATIDGLESPLGQLDDATNTTDAALRRLRMHHASRPLAAPV